MNPVPALTGRWQMIRAELAGEAAPEIVTSRMILEIGAGTYAVSYADQISDSGTWEPGTAEGTLILRGRSGPNSGRDRKSTRLNSSHVSESRMPSSA